MRVIRSCGYLFAVFALLAIVFSGQAHADEEALARQAEEAGKLREALTHYVSALQSTSEGSTKDQQLRETIIKLAQKIQPPPAVPDKVVEYEGRAEAAVQEAKTPQDYLDAAKEYRKALRLAPWVASYYFNLGVVLEKAGKPEEAIRTFNFYLLAAPNAPDAREVKKKIAGLKYKQEKAAKEKQGTVPQVEKTEKPWTEKLNGKWTEVSDESGNIYSFRVTGKQIEIRMVSFKLHMYVGPTKPARDSYIPVNEVIFRGSIEGKWIKGTYYYIAFSTKYTRNYELLEKEVQFRDEYSVDGPIALSPDGNKLYWPAKLHGTTQQWKRVQ